MSLKCSALYLAQFRYKSPGLLANGDGTKTPTVIGDVYIHPSAKVHPTAKVNNHLLFITLYIYSVLNEFLIYDPSAPNYNISFNPILILLIYSIASVIVRGLILFFYFVNIFNLHTNAVIVGFELFIMNYNIKNSFFYVWIFYGTTKYLEILKFAYF